MTQEKTRKAILVCRIVTVASALLEIILLTVLLARGTGINDAAADALKIAVYILCAGVFLPPFVILHLRAQGQSHRTEERIRELEKEVERLKKNQTVSR